MKSKALVVLVFSFFILFSTTSYAWNRYLYDFTLSPATDTFDNTGQKDNYEENASIVLDSTTDSNQKVYYRVCNGPDTNSFISETKWASVPFSFYLTYYNGHAHPQNVWLRGYACSSNTDTVYHYGAWRP